MKNLIVIFTLPVFKQKYPFYVKFISLKSKLFVETQIWILDYFKYVEFDSDFHYIPF